MYKARLAELKKEQEKIAKEIRGHESAVAKLTKRIDTIVTEIAYVKALDVFQRTGKALPQLSAKAPTGKRGAGKKRGRAKKAKTGGKRIALTKLIPEVLASSGKALTTNELIDGLSKVGWKTAASKPYPVVYNSAATLVKKGVIKKSGSGKFSVKK